ncbi:Alpha-actinin-4 [Cichlidogyrus casuarinus]|uniref:Alpha-actinin-4 n=1 Tax=Cichlidogyrus casuarinus TaxID=1844966 RepID=A0ABD2Q0Z0_9PLAT
MRLPLTTLRCMRVVCCVDLLLTCSVAFQGEADFARVMQSADTDKRGFVTFESFVDFMTKEMSDQDSENQLLESFRLLAGDKGRITEEDLRRDLPVEDAEYCIQQMKLLAAGEGDHLDFQSFTKILYG